MFRNYVSREIVYTPFSQRHIIKLMCNFVTGFEYSTVRYNDNQ